MVPLVYHAEYVTPLPEGHRFPMQKFRLLAELLESEGILGAENRMEPELPSRADLERIHVPAYLGAFRGGSLDARSQRRIGLPWSQGLVRRTHRAVGGTLRTAELALQYGIACNTAGGTHHAFPAWGSGFCILNDLAIAAASLRARNMVESVLVFDLDVHQGDGTAAACAEIDGVWTVSVHCGDNFPFRKQRSDLDRELPAGAEDARYLETVASTLVDALEMFRPDLVLYDAGVDVCLEDRLGKLAISRAGLRAREELVLEFWKRVGIPVAAVIGGGYDRNLAALVDRHAELHRAAVRVHPGASGVRA